MTSWTMFWISTWFKDYFQSVLCSLGTLMFIYIINLTRWNRVNWCYSLQTTYLIFEAFQILFPTSSLIFTAANCLNWDHQIKSSTNSTKAMTVIPTDQRTAKSWNFKREQSLETLYERNQDSVVRLTKKPLWFSVLLLTFCKWRTTVGTL